MRASPAEEPVIAREDAMPNLPKYDIEGLAKYLVCNKREGIQQPELVADLYGIKLSLAVRGDDFV